MKKLISLFTSLVLVLSLATVGFAADKVETAVSNNTGRDYHAHQVFAGTQATGEANLASVTWGSGVDTTKTVADKTLIQAIQAITLDDDSTPFAQCETAADVAEVLSTGITGYAYNTEKALCFAKVVNHYLSTGEGAYTPIDSNATTVSIEPGYYLLEDTTQGTAGQDTVLGLSLLQITGHTITINSKTDKPTVGKKVQDEVADRDIDSLESAGGWGETADHAINESFKFELIASIPDATNVSLYEKYKVVFHDTMSAGVTFESIDSVKINDTTVPLKAEGTPNGYYLSNNAVNGAAGITWTLTIDDIKPYLPDQQATSTEGVTTITVIYNAHLNENAVVGNIDDNENTVYLEYSNNPNVGGEGELGKTSEDTVWVFTYKIDGTKYKNAIQDVNKLAGAGFTLYSETEYAKYNDSDPATVATPVHLVKDEDGYHYPVAAGTTDAITEMVTGADGIFNVKGLDTGVYYLVETTVPSGYNKCDDVKVTISATHEEIDATNAHTEISMKQDEKVASDLKIDVVNNAGAVLPETGGMGTTLFYVVGAALVLGAVVLLVTKRRMNSAE